MPTGLANLITLVEGYYELAEYWSGRIGDALFSAGSYLQEQDFQRAGNALRNCHDYFAYFSTYMTTDSGSADYYLIDALEWINANWPEEVEAYELTLTKMLEQMAIPKPAEILGWVAVTDAYRAALWDEPYNADYYALFVRLFKQWA